jgi:CHAT domain-containing protein/tetratricopeptide (TPR) repeat protein
MGLLAWLRKRAKASSGARSKSILNELFQSIATLHHERRWAEALPLAQRATDLARSHLGEAHPAYAASLNNLALAHQAIGDYAAALPLLQRASEILGAALGESDPDYATNLRSLAMVYHVLGDHAAALPLSRRAMEIHRAARGEDHPDYAASLASLAIVHEAIGDYAAALPLYRQVAQNHRAFLGEDHPLYAASLDGLAGVHRAMGDHAAALPLLRQAAEIRRVALGKAHPHYAQSLYNLANLHQTMGDYPAALSLYRQSAEITRVFLGEDHSDHAASLYNLASLHQAMGDYHAALPLLKRAAEITRAARGEDHPDHAMSLDGLANVHKAMGDHAAALPLHRRAAEITRAALGEHHPHYAGTLNNLAILHQETGDYPTALSLHRQAAEITRAALGENHPRYAGTLNNLAVVLTATNRAAEALLLLQQAAAIDDRMIGQVLTIGSEGQRIAFLQTLRSRLYLTLSLVLEYLGESPAATRAAFDLVLRRKAIAAEATATQRDAVLGGKYPALRPRLQELVALRMQVARATLAGPGPEGPEAHRRRLAEWSAQKERLESELAGQVPEMNLERKLRAADRRAVASALPKGVALVEFVRFYIYDFRAVAARGERSWHPEHYMAFVLWAGDPDDVRMIDLGEAEPIDLLIADFRAGVLAADRDRNMTLSPRLEVTSPTSTEGLGTQLRAALFDRLMPALGGHTRLLIAPDGDLTRLPFEVLPGAADSRLIDGYRISYLGCGRDALRLGAAATGTPTSPLLFADPDFDLQIDERPAPDTEPAAHLVSRRSRDLDRQGDTHHFPRLPGTRAEGQQIAALLGVQPTMDAAALEGRLKAQCRSPHILHLATHGFFLPDQQPELRHAAPSPGVAPIGFPGAEPGAGQQSGPLMEDPMLRSGMALAGANTWLKAGELPDEAEDGLLTAEDVTGLDLLATELVVLSACETGLGQVHVGEGVFGLRRAFVLAGARTLVMSLWKVPDDQTRELMEDFYRRLLAGEGRAEALRQAQLAMKAKYPSPFYWGAFICQGDPSPLGPVQPGTAGSGIATDWPTG